jgi:hypothetical protein
LEKEYTLTNVAPDISGGNQTVSVNYNTTGDIHTFDFTNGANTDAAVITKHAEITWTIEDTIFSNWDTFVDDHFAISDEGVLSITSSFDGDDVVAAGGLKSIPLKCTDTGRSSFYDEVSVTLTLSASSLCKIQLDANLGGISGGDSTTIGVTGLGSDGATVPAAGGEDIVVHFKRSDTGSDSLTANYEVRLWTTDGSGVLSSVVDSKTIGTATIWDVRLTHQPNYGSSTRNLWVTVQYMEDRSSTPYLNLWDETEDDHDPIPDNVWSGTQYGGAPGGGGGL